MRGFLKDSSWNCSFFSLFSGILSGGTEGPSPGFFVPKRPWLPRCTSTTSNERCGFAEAFCVGRLVGAWHWDFMGLQVVSIWLFFTNFCMLQPQRKRSLALDKETSQEKGSEFGKLFDTDASLVLGACPRLPYSGTVDES